MSRSDKPVKVVLTATICLVASSSLQGTTTTAQANPAQEWNDVQNFIVRDAEHVAQARPFGPGTYPALEAGPRPLGPGTYPALEAGPRPLGPGTYPALEAGPRPLGPGTYPALEAGPRPLGPGTYPALSSVEPSPTRKGKPKPATVDPGVSIGIDIGIGGGNREERKPRSDEGGRRGGGGDFGTGGGGITFGR
jgi:hypothetical protein